MGTLFGRDVDGVRIHTDTRATESARALSASAYTMGEHVVFGAGSFAPGTPVGDRLLVHEITHVLQAVGRTAAARPAPVAWEPHYQDVRDIVSSPSDAAEVEAAANASRVAYARSDVTPRAGAGTGMTHPASPAQGFPAAINRELDPSKCASDCTTADKSVPATGRYSLTVLVDREGSFLFIPFTKGVGHAWIELRDKDGSVWSYGFWPQSGFDAKEPFKDVAGCVWKGEQGGHKPGAQQSFDLTKQEFDRAHKLALDLCGSRPAYNLVGLQCTEFVSRVLAAAGRGPALGFGLIFESPAAMSSWLQSNQVVIGASMTGATTASGGQGAGEFGIHAEVTRQFMSLLGNKVRLEWLARGELSSRMASATAAVGAEVTSQRVYLPRAYLFGGVTAGELTPGRHGSGDDKFGAGVAAGAGLRYNVDEFAVVGVEANLVKDLVSQDPALGRLMVTAGLKF